MIEKAGHRRLTERSQEFGTSFISEKELEIRYEGSGNGCKGGMRRGGLINIPLRSFACKRALEQYKMDGIISNGIG